MGNDTGVVSLDRFREAARTSKWLTGALERAGWVLSVQPEVASGGEVIIVVVVEPPVTVMRRRCLPTACNCIRIEVRERTAC